MSFDRRVDSEEERESAIAALAARFQADEFSETVYRASLFALGRRGADIDHIVNRQMELKNERPARLPKGHAGPD